MPEKKKKKTFYHSASSFAWKDWISTISSNENIFSLWEMWYFKKVQKIVTVYGHKHIEIHGKIFL